MVSAACAANPAVQLVVKPNGGKASALNVGVARAAGEIVVVVDGDTVLAPGAIEALVAPLADDRVGAVAGNAKVGNRINLVTRWQAVEYVTSQNLDRRAFALLNCITVVPGAVGAWRRQLVLEVSTAVVAGCQASPERAGQNQRPASGPHRSSPCRIRLHPGSPASTGGQALSQRSASMAEVRDRGDVRAE